MGVVHGDRGFPLGFRAGYAQVGYNPACFMLYVRVIAHAP
ncbi:hypothetical protein RSAG8_04826, partial [Rhizoctonia solani AG-8 WAC10335]